MSLFYASAPVDFNSAAPSCDCLAHVYGNAADHPDRVRRYPSDMSEAEWAAVRPLLPVPAWLEGKGGQPEGYCHRQMLDAIRYLVAGGIFWRAMPADFPSWGRVYAFFRRWREHGLTVEFHDRLRGRVREREGREAQPSAGIIDAQSVRAAASVPAATRGYDGGKKVPGRQTAHRDRHARPAAARRGDRRERRRPGCGRAPTGTATHAAPGDHPGLGRRRFLEEVEREAAAATVAVVPRQRKRKLPQAGDRARAEGGEGGDIPGQNPDVPTEEAA